jgi:tripartite-type tricarboxylate transporter receptor subunit TctC
MSYTRSLALASTLALALFSIPSLGAEYPAKPIRLVVPYPAGGAIDPPARIIAEKLSERIGQQLFVDNRPGGGSTIGIQQVADAPPDGYTLLFSASNISITHALMKSTVRFDPSDSFTHVARVAYGAGVIVVHPSSRFKTLNELVAFARANPGALTYASPGNGSPAHLSMEIFKRGANIELRHIPYKGAAPAMTDLLGNRVDMANATLAGPIGHIKSGALRALAVTSSQRAAELPEVPTVAETVPGFETVTWFGVSGPKGLPAEVVQKLSAELERAITDPATMKRLQDVGITPDYRSGAELSAHIRKEADMYARVIADAKIKID